MKWTLLDVKDWIIGIAGLITACKIIWDIAKKPGTRLKNDEKDIEGLKQGLSAIDKRVTKVEKNNDKIEIIIEKLNNLTAMYANQNQSLNVSLEERKLLINSNRTVIKCVSALMDQKDPKQGDLKKELDKSLNDLDEFITNQSHKNDINI